MKKKISLSAKQLVNPTIEEFLLFFQLSKSNKTKNTWDPLRKNWKIKEKSRTSSREFLTSRYSGIKSKIASADNIQTLQQGIYRQDKKTWIGIPRWHSLPTHTQDIFFLLLRDRCARVFFSHLFFYIIYKKTYNKRRERQPYIFATRFPSAHLSF